MSGTLETLSSACDVARLQVKRSAYYSYSDQDLGEGPQPTVDDALDRLCRAHEALQQERDAQKCDDEATRQDDLLASYRKGKAGRSVSWCAEITARRDQSRGDAQAIRATISETPALRAPAPVREER